MNNKFYVIIDGRDCTGLDSLLSELAIKLQFPNYFGYNLDALQDCINDLDSIGYNSICLVLNNWSSILSGDKKNKELFYNILSSAVRGYNIEEGEPAFSFILSDPVAILQP